ncbi:LexA family protein [Bosea lathyri]|nr:S24 family peptidase [Bosea lathyri]
MSSLKDFVTARLKQLDRNPFEAARTGSLERSFVNDILIGKKQSVQGANIAKLALALDCAATDIVAAMAGRAPALGAEPSRANDISSASEIRPTTESLIPIKVAGKLKAGDFIAIEDLGDWDEPEVIYDRRDPRFPDARHMAFEVDGDSMNALKPRPIMSGDRLSAISYEDVADRLPLRDGMIVAVERTRHGGLEREWSVKQLEIYEDRVEFHPRSTNPRHKPIVVVRDNNADDGTKVEIIAIIRRLVAEFNL